MKSEELLRQQLFPFEFDRHYSLKNFFVFEGNEAAFRSANLLCEEREGEGPPSLFLYGEAGCGKTHLLQAIGNALAEKNIRRVVKLLPLKLLRERLACSSNDEEGVSGTFKRYEGADALLVDDIEELASTPLLQEALFHLFNHFRERSKIFVATGKESPAEMSALSPHLTTRLGWGLAVKIGPPDESARKNILKRLADERKLGLEEREMDFILAHYPRDYSSMKRIVEAINDYSLLTRRKITVPLIKEACRTLKDI